MLQTTLFEPFEVLLVKVDPNLLGLHPGARSIRMLSQLAGSHKNPVVEKAKLIEALKELATQAGIEWETQGHVTLRQCVDCRLKCWPVEIIRKHEWLCVLKLKRMKLHDPVLE